MTGLFAGPVGVLLADAVLVQATPFAELGPLAQLGVGGVVLAIWWIERKERVARQVQDDARYAELQTKLLDALKRPVRCPLTMDPTSGQAERR